MTQPLMIAIDGPAASGKTTLALLLAHRLGYLYFDTGVMYRAVTLAAMQRGVNLGDEAAVTRLSEEIVIDVVPPALGDGRPCIVYLDGKDVTSAIRAHDVDGNVSIPSAYRGVRAAMTAQQRRIGERGRVVMVGRDIGTVVLPQADLKIYLDASIEARARRRWQESLRNDDHTLFDDILAAMIKRDEIDSQRAVAPLRPAADAVVIDSTSLDADAVFERVMRMVANSHEASGGG